MDKGNLRWNDGYKALLSIGCTSDIKQHYWETVFKCNKKGETLGKVISISQDIILISQSSEDAIGKIETIGNMPCVPNKIPCVPIN